MDLNVLSPDQMNSLRIFDYKTLQTVPDADCDDTLYQSNRDLNRVRSTMHLQNQRTQRDVDVLQTLLDSVILKPNKKDPEFINEIRWDLYYYKKYTYQLHILWVIIGVCILLNLYTLVPEYQNGLVGITLLISILYICSLIWDLYIRDSHNFDEYEFSNYTGTIHRSKNTQKSHIDLSNCVVDKLHDKMKAEYIKNYVKL
jgi:hypothetical protein